MEIEDIKYLAGQLISTLHNFTTANRSISEEGLSEPYKDFLYQSEQLKRELNRVLSPKIEKVPESNIQKGR